MTDAKFMLYLPAPQRPLNVESRQDLTPFGNSERGVVQQALARELFQSAECRSLGYW
jgi:hypothetical protein